MSRMIRKQVYIESRQDATLKQQARALGVTEAEVIRRAIDCQMTSVRLGARDPKSMGAGEGIHCQAYGQRPCFRGA